MKKPESESLVVMAKDFQEVRQEILQMHRRVQEENYYELLGVSPEADDAMVSSRFRRLAKKWHVDRFSNYDLGADRQKVQEIFAALNSAHRTLTDPNERAEYDMEIDDGPDIGAILDAETDFRRGKNLLETGSYKGAHELFKSAVELNPDELEFRAYYLYTEYLQIPKDDQGLVKSKKRAKEIFDELDDLSAEMPEKDWLLAFLGTIALGLDHDKQAEGLFNEALMLNPHNTSAQRQMRLINMRRKRGEKGIFGKLMDKIRGG